MSGGLLLAGGGAPFHAATLTGLLGLSITVPSFPGIGDTWIVAALFFGHIVIAEYSLGAITLAVAMEAYAVRSGSAYAWRYSERAATSYYLLFSLGATFAVFVVVILTGLWANDFASLLNEFLPLVGLAFGSFFVTAPLLVWYRNTFFKMGARPHLVLGVAVACWQTLFMVLIVGLDSYLITPPKGEYGFGQLLNPTYLPLLMHRFIGNVSWTALLLAGVAAILARRSGDPGEHAFQFWAARVNLRIGLIAALLMPVDGFILVLIIRDYQVGFFSNLVGTFGNYMIVQEVLVGVILVGGNIALAHEGGGLRASPLGQVLTAITAIGMLGATLPSVVIVSSVYWVRYVFLGLAMLATAVHLGVRWNPRGLMAQAVRGVTLRRSLVTIGLVSMATALFMGYIKEQARTPYAIYGVLTQNDAHGHFLPPGKLYP